VTDLAYSSAVFTDAVTLKPAGAEHFDLAFTAVTQPCPWPKAYGGDLVAQAAAAAMRSVTDGRTLHSTHSYFMRPAEIGAEIRYEVELLRDRRGYSTRQVRATRTASLSTRAWPGSRRTGAVAASARSFRPSSPGFRARTNCPARRSTSATAAAAR
jgi:hypothetical protein